MQIGASDRKSKFENSEHIKEGIEQYSEEEEDGDVFLPQNS